MTDTSPPRLHLAHVAIENVKGIRGCHVAIEDGALVPVTGGNGDGKSSFIDAIWYALVGTQPLAKGRKQPAGYTPVTVGEQKGSVELRLDGHPTYTVTRRWNGTKSDVTVVNTETGRREANPVDTLRQLVGELAVDPLRFMSEPAGKQMETLTAALRLELVLDGEIVELDTFDEAIEAARAERHTVNEEIRRLDAVIGQTPAPPADLPTEPVSIDDLLAEQEAAQAVNQQRRDAHNQMTRARERNEQAGQRVASLRAQLREAEADLAQTQAALRAAEAVEVPDEVDEDSIRRRISEVTQTNTLIEGGRRRAGQVQELTDRQREAATLLARIDNLRQHKADALAEAKMPYPGLSIDPGGDGITLNGVPLKDCSAAEQRLVACALAMDPDATIRLIRVEDGSLLDPDFLRDLEQMATERDYQVLIEIVDPDGDQGIVFSDGRIVSAYGKTQTDG